MFSTNDDYYKNQIITYLGNKRKFVDIIETIVQKLEGKNKKKLIIGDGFSGSGILSRVFKNNSSKLYTNDIAGYSNTINKCYLSKPSQTVINEIKKHVDKANNFVDLEWETNKSITPFIQLHWAPSSTNISQKDRVYFTYENGKRIDAYMHYITKSTPESLKHYLLAPLLVEISIHNNTNGQFTSYYKDKNGKGKYGGSKEIDLNRITSPIKLPYPIFSKKGTKKVVVSQIDTNEWVKTLPKMDLVYYDPPYNKHPYCIYYFLLDIVNNWNTDIDIPDTYRGQPKNWKKSNYCSRKHAKKTFEDLILNTNSKYILLSYNNGGIIPLNDLDSILNKYGTVEKIPVTHKTYNKLKGIANYKRKEEKKETKEFLWLLEKKP
jgi:adenine-specific DNA-methyltransferase